MHTTTTTTTHTLSLFSSLLVLIQLSGQLLYQNDCYIQHFMLLFCIFDVLVS